MLKRLEKMEEFIDDFKDCLENSEEEDDDFDFREHHNHDYEDDEELKKIMNRYSKLRKRMGK